MNAAVFVGFVTAMTFALFLLFKYRLGKVIWAYMGFSGFLIFGILGGNICMQVLQKLDVAVDMVTVSVALWNFTVGGVLLTCLLYTSPSPRDKRQSRMPSSA